MAKFQETDKLSINEDVGQLTKTLINCRWERKMENSLAVYYKTKDLLYLTSIYVAIPLLRYLSRKMKTHDHIKTCT